MAAALEARALVKEHRRGRQVVRALDGVDLTVGSGEFVSVVGPSGSGKSTLLHLLGGLDRPTSGTVRVAGEDLAGLPDDALAALRRRRLGFVFQFFNLLPGLAAWENAALALVLDGRRLPAVRDRVVALLGEVGLGDRVDHRPAELSGGELQRVAIVRALAAEPAVVLADEPTGNLDSHTGEAVLEVLRGVTRAEGRAVVMVTHDLAAADAGDRVVRLVDGRVERGG